MPDWPDIRDPGQQEPNGRYEEDKRDLWLKTTDLRNMAGMRRNIERFPVTIATVTKNTNMPTTAFPWTLA
jgi:hypothetical protein